MGLIYYYRTQVFRQEPSLLLLALYKYYKIVHYTKYVCVCGNHKIANKYSYYCIAKSANQESTNDLALAVSTETSTESLLKAVHWYKIICMHPTLVQLTFSPQLDVNELAYTMLCTEVVDGLQCDWAIYWTLGNFLKPLATINLSKSPTFFGIFCKGVKLYLFYATFKDIWRFFLVTLNWPAQWL